jgi:hypothetical protein
MSSMCGRGASLSEGTLGRAGRPSDGGRGEAGRPDGVDCADAGQGERAPSSPSEAGTVGYRMRERCFANDLIMRHVGDRMIIAPPLVITPAEIDVLIERAKKSLDESYASLNLVWTGASVGCSSLTLSLLARWAEEETKSNDEGGVGVGGAAPQGPCGPSPRDIWRRESHSKAVPANRAGLIRPRPSGRAGCGGRLRRGAVRSVRGA